MNTEEYLEALLASQDLATDSDEMKELRQHRADVETLLRDAFGDASPTIRYGGSKAKGTLIRESYDLDIVCYFPSGENGAGESLKDIFENVSAALSEEYSVAPKTSALRLHSHDVAWSDFHIDVVPGRFTDDTKGDCYLYQNGVDKERLKTNLDIHVAHIRDAGVTSALRLLKLWRFRNGLQIKNFAWELLCIKLLSGLEEEALATQLEHVLQSVADSDEALSIEDPANPKGNDVMEFLRSVWWDLQMAAKQTLNVNARSGWEGVFGSVEAVEKAEKVARAVATAAVVREPTQPWRP